MPDPEWTQPCRFDYLCKLTGKYNPAKTVINNRGVRSLNKCTHEGGPGCKPWRDYTDREITGEELRATTRRLL